MALIGIIKHPRGIRLFFVNFYCKDIANNNTHKTFNKEARGSSSYNKTCICKLIVIFYYPSTNKTQNVLNLLEKVYVGIQTETAMM